MSHKNCSRRKFLKISGISMAAFVLRGSTASPADKPARRPNIIFIYTDDQAAWTPGYIGNKQARTPNIDRLAAQGVYLANSFVTTPVCSPSRAGLMTGRYASELGVLDFIPHPGHKLYEPDKQIGLSPDTVTFAEVLAMQGYTNGLVGKWHLGDWTETSDKKYHPLNHGFDYFMGLTGGGISPSDPILEENSQVKQFKGLTTDILTDRALGFVEKHKDDTFMLCLNYRAPHKAWLPVADADWAPYENMEMEIPNPDYPDLNVRKVKTMMKEYLASIAGIDRNLGRLLKLLDEQNLSDNTVVIYSSDHGYNMGHNGIWHKGNGIWATHSVPADTENIKGKYRPNLYDQSLRVPAIVRWPGIVKAGSVITETISNLDWYPTLVSIANAKMPAGQTVRGRDFTPLLRGQKIDGWENGLYAEYSMRNYCRTHLRAYRTPEWKLIRDFLNPQRDELYCLKNDPAENINLINSRNPNVRKVIKELDEKILENVKKTSPSLIEPYLKR
ncbi:Arylsulfatase [Limihaloglobus sulfuriphilus]|uniref:Arylsulfatase n=1 Tax=Limihaloglobus sulfuriphilus TaxID=1851148 RepID=A0A1R7T658_9BACT|nr:sulfatase-like hydrolase/transferase [Limihaloglobus sulfuriphilus]AQQ72356.1 Arylsulfatase [Limihaloglobus sulfuriphilus]